MFNRGQHRVGLFMVLLLLVLGGTAVSAQGTGQPASSPSGAFSVDLPAGWVTEPVTQPNFKDILVFGSSPAALQFMVATVTGTQPTDASGVGGFIGQLDLSQAQPGSTPQSFVDPLLQVMTQNMFAGAQTQSQPYTFGGQYPGTLVVAQAGFVGAFATATDVFIVVVVTDNMAANQAAMTSVLDGIHAGGGAAPLVPTVAGTRVKQETPAEVQTVRSSDQRVSLDIPADWTVLDRVADKNVLAYGNTLDAAQSRLASASPDLAEKKDISGIGGLVILYPAANFKVDPQNPDLNGLMTQVMQQLEGQGYTTQSPEQLEGFPGGLSTYIEGTEVGYLALIPFGDQIAYVTATGTLDTFPDAEGLLQSVLDSVRSPAVPESTGGLGGLGGLGSATPEATSAPLGGLGGLSAPAEPTATVPALGGLGGLNATPEASS